MASPEVGSNKPLRILISVVYGGGEFMVSWKSSAQSARIQREGSSGNAGRNTGKKLDQGRDKQVSNTWDTFPAPLWPSNPKHSPWGMRKDMDLTATELEFCRSPSKREWFSGGGGGGFREKRGIAKANRIFLAKRHHRYSSFADFCYGSLAFSQDVVRHVVITLSSDGSGQDKGNSAGQNTSQTRKKEVSMTSSGGSAVVRGLN